MFASISSTSKFRGNLKMKIQIRIQIDRSPCWL